MEFNFKDKKIFVSKQLIQIAAAAMLIFICYKISRQIVSGTVIKNLFLLVFLGFFIYFLGRPKLVFYLFIFFLPFTEIFQLMKADFLCLPNILGLFVLFLILVKLAEGEKLKLYKTPLDWPIFILLIIFILSMLQSRFIPLNFEVLEATRFNRPFNRSFLQIVALMYIMVLYYMTNSLINSKEDLIKIIRIWIISSITVTLLGIYGFFGYSMGFPFTKDLVILDGFIPRAKSILREPMFLGLYLMTVMPLIFSMILGKIKLIPRRWLISFFVLLAVLLAFSLARAAWIALIVSLHVVFLYYYKSQIKGLRWIFLILIIMGLIFLFMGNVYSKAGLERFFVFRFYNLHEDFSTLSRLDSIVAGYNMFKAHPFFGVGYGNYPFHFLSCAPDFHYVLFAWLPQGIFTFPNAHNIFVNYLAETGIIGAFAICLLLLTVLITTFNAIKRTHDSFYRPVLIGYFASFVAVVIIYQFFSTINISFIWIFIAVIMSVQRLALKDKV